MSHREYVNVGSAKSKVIEEIGELLQAIGKVERFGLFNFHPDRPHMNNRSELLGEIADLENALARYKSELAKAKEPRDA